MGPARNLAVVKSNRFAVGLEVLGRIPPNLNVSQAFPHCSLMADRKNKANGMNVLILYPIWVFALQIYFI